MTGPLYPPNDPGSPIPVGQNEFPLTFPVTLDSDSLYAPSVFMSDYEFPAPGTVVVPSMPRSQGGIIEAVKTATVQAFRDALQGVSLFDQGQSVYITIDYPTEQVQFPGLWVQFSISKLNRAGVGHEIATQVNGVWTFIQEWIFEGRLTLTMVALKSLDRDRLADAVMASLAFARPPGLLLTMPNQDTRQNRSLITALDENPYIALTLQLDTIIPGGESASQGTPWGDDAALVYENSYSVDMVGNFNLQFSQDGVYTLAEIRPNITMSSTGQVYDPILWQNIPSAQPVNPAQLGSWLNQSNTDIPAM